MAIFKMAAVAILESQVRAIKWAIIAPISMKFGTQTKTDMLSSKITKAEVYKMAKKSRKINC
jgi:hypothetical protein